LRHRGLFPVDVNKATREMLLRVPGLGVRNVKRILQIRRFKSLRLADLKKLRVPLKRAKPFIIAADRNPANDWIDAVDLAKRFEPKRKQLTLFDAATGAATGEL